MATIEKKAVIIGAGTGGYPCAIRLGQLKVDTMLIEKDKPGGVCLNWGCIPSKALISATKLVTKASHAGDMGIRFGTPEVDMPKMQAWKSGIVNKLTSGVKQLVKGNGATYVQGTAEILGRKGDRYEIKVTYPDGKPADTVLAEHLVVATGSVPIQIPGFEYDQERIVDSTGALEIDKVPGEMVCVGGGIIGLELGQTFQRLGTKLTVVEGLERILGAVDKDLAQVVAKQIKKDGGEVLTHAKAMGWEERDGKAVVKVQLKDGSTKEVPADVVLVAVGRRPVAKGFGLDKLGVKINERGFVITDAKKQTNVPRVYAVGDVAGQPMLAHKASHEGELVAEIIAGHDRVDDARTIPNVVFTEPEIASAGLGEVEAKEAGYDVNVGKFPFAASGRAMAIAETAGFVKVLIDRADNRVLGIHVVGPEASDLISEGALAIEMGAFAEDMSLTVHPHPTLGEAVMEAAKASIGEAIHVMNRVK